jgi:mRNA interferase HigB
VRVISQKTLRDFWTRRPDAQEPLRQWFKTASAAQWQSLADLRRVYPQADGVPTARDGVLTVFNIGGNKYRLIVRIPYEWKLINVRCVLTHSDYNKGNWRR